MQQQQQPPANADEDASAVMQQIGVITIWKTLQKDMARAGLSPRQIVTLRAFALESNGRVLKHLKSDPRIKNSVRTVLTKRSFGRLTTLAPAQQIALKMRFCEGIFCHNKWYGRDYVQLLHSVGVGVYLTEQVLLEYTGDMDMSRKMHALFRKMGKGQKDIVRDLLVREAYDDVKRHFPFHVSFLDAPPTFQQLCELKCKKQMRATTLHSHGRSASNIDVPSVVSRRLPRRRPRKSQQSVEEVIAGFEKNSDDGDMHASPNWLDVTPLCLDDVNGELW
jgi:hypothetical protein